MVILVQALTRAFFFLTVLNFTNHYLEDCCSNDQYRMVATASRDLGPSLYKVYGLW